MEGGAARRTGGFVGRERELEALSGTFEEVLAGSGRLAMLAGEPGIGKTRAAEEFARIARAGGAQVFWGPCHEGEGAPAYWPWVQILRDWVHDRAPQEIERAMGLGISDIAQLVPEVGRGLAELAVPPTLAPEQARFRLFDSVTTFVKNAAHDTPLVLIIDDLQWADTPSLRLLSFLARELRETRLLLLGAYRHAELGRGHPLLQTLGELTIAQRVVLRGLAEPEVHAFVQATMGVKPEASLVADVTEMTEGNPFFVAEVVRLLVSEGQLRLQRTGPLTIPQGVREVIGRRLDRLSDECNRVLAMAAVVGRVFEAALLEPIVDLAPARFAEVLDEALNTTVLEEVGDTPGRYRFTHTLIRETVYDEIPLTKRVEMHRLIGESLEKLYSFERDAHLVELSHHFVEAALAGGDLVKAIDYARKAGERATKQLAYEDAIGHYERALRALDVRRLPPDVTRCRLLLLLGAAQARAGDLNAAKHVYREAAEIARASNAASELAEAALGYGTEAVGPEGIGATGQVDPVLVELLEQALAMLEQGDSSLRSRLLGRLAVALYWSEQERERRVSLAQEAEDMAERLGDRAALAAAMASRRYALLGSEQLDETIAVAKRILAMAHEVGDQERVLQAHRWLISAFLDAGDIEGVDAEIDVHERLARELRLPIYMGYSVAFRAMRAIMEGRFAEGEALAEEAHSIGQRAQNQVATLWFMAQMTAYCQEQGRYDSLTEMFDALAKLPISAPLAVRAAVTNMLMEGGRIEEARSNFDRLAAHDFADVPVTLTSFLTFAYLANICAALGDARRAPMLYELLVRGRGRHVFAGPPAMMYCGPVDYFLGLLAATMGKHADALEHLESALASTRLMGAKPFSAKAACAIADVLIKTGEDDERARSMLDRVAVRAEELGMRPLVEHVHSLQARLEKTAQEAGPAAPDVNMFRREGDYWSISFGGSLIRLKDAKGLNYLALLMRHPAKQFHVDELAAAVDGSALPEETVALGGDAGPLLDAEAKSAYRARLEELQERLEEAETNHDAGTAGRAREEMEFLAAELAAASGLGGRDRKAVSMPERQRVRVTKALRGALVRIAEADPALGRHLADSLHTGYFCCYQPQDTVAWEFDPAPSAGARGV